MGLILAVDGAELSVDGVGFPIPKGTAIGIRGGNDSNMVVTGTEQNGDGTKTPIYSVITSMFEGIVVTISSGEKEDYFNNMFAPGERKIVVSNGGTDYALSKAVCQSPSEDGTPSIESNTRKSEAFSIVSLSGKMQRT